MKNVVKGSKVSSEKGNNMPKKIKVIKSPIPEGVMELPISPVGHTTISITLPSGIVITAPEQFEDDDTTDIEACPE
jgi:hypothetical protein